MHSRTIPSINSREISSTNILRQYHQHSAMYDMIPSTLVTSNTISLPFTYYQDSPIQQTRANFEKISAWLDHTVNMAKKEQDNNHVLFIDASQQQSISSSSSVEIDNKGKRNSIRFSFFSSKTLHFK
jgi:hypothetical protein